MPELTLSIEEALRLAPGCTSLLDEKGLPKHRRLAERLRRAGLDPGKPIEAKVDLDRQEIRFRQ